MKDTLNRTLECGEHGGAVLVKKHIVSMVYNNWLSWVYLRVIVLYQNEKILGKNTWKKIKKILRLRRDRGVRGILSKLNPRRGRGARMRVLAFL